jgi:hypothetical protein
VMAGFDLGNGADGQLGFAEVFQTGHDRRFGDEFVVAFQGFAGFAQDPVDLVEVGVVGDADLDDGAGVALGEVGDRADLAVAEDVLLAGRAESPTLAPPSSTPLAPATRPARRRSPAPA